MKKSRYFIIRFLAILALLVGMNEIYVHTNWTNDVSKHADLLDSLARYQDSTEVLLLSSSSNYFYWGKDTSYKAISDYLQLYYPEIEVNAINKGYLHAGMFRSIVQNIPPNAPLQTLVLEVNLRSFGAFWLQSKVETSYAVQDLMMNPQYPKLLRRFLFALSAYDKKSESERKLLVDQIWRTSPFTIPYSFPFNTVHEWEQEVVHRQFPTKSDGSKNWYLTDKCSGLIKAYAFDPYPQAKVRFEAFDDIVTIASSRGWNVVMVIMPANVDRIHDLLGPEIPRLLLAAQRQIKERYEQPNVRIIEALTAFPSDQFYEEYPTEHYLSSGKAWLAKQIATEISQFDPIRFQPATLDFPNPSPTFTEHEDGKLLKFKADSARQYELSQFAGYHRIPYRYFLENEIISLMRLEGNRIARD